MKLQFDNSILVDAKFAEEDQSVEIYSRLRTEPFEGMKQPTPNGCTFGYETILGVYQEGKASPNHSLEVLVQSDEFGKDKREYITGIDGQVRLEVPLGAQVEVQLLGVKEPEAFP